MRAGISTASLFMRKNNEQSLAILRDFGVDCAEVFLTSFFEYGRESGERLAAKKGGIEMNSVHALTSQFEPQLFSRHEGVRADAFHILGSVMDAASALGAKYYSFHGTTRAKRAARNPENDNFASMGKSLAEIFEFCKRKGVTLCLENVEWSTYNRPGVFTEMKRYIPELCGVLDVKQARISGVPYQAYLKEMGADIAYVHLSDITFSGKMCLPGKGVFDTERLVKELADVGFDGAILIEAYEKDYREIAELKGAYEYLQEVIARV